MYLYGASGHGKVVADILRSKGIVVDGFIDDNADLVSVSGIPVFHTAEMADELIVSIGGNQLRRQIVQRLVTDFPHVAFASAVHSSSIVSPSAIIGKGTVVMGGTVINAEACIGNHCIVNTGASIDHECILGDYVDIAPHSTLCGNVRVGEGSWIGAGSTIIQGVTIGKWCIIGAGSVVTKDIPDGYLAVGNRCKLYKKINQNLL